MEHYMPLRALGFSLLTFFFYFPTLGIYVSFVFTRNDVPIELCKMISTCQNSFNLNGPSFVRPSLTHKSQVTVYCITIYGFLYYTSLSKYLFCKWAKDLNYLSYIYFLSPNIQLLSEWSPSKYAHILNPGTCEYINYMAKRLSRC